MPRDKRDWWAGLKKADIIVSLCTGIPTVAFFGWGLFNRVTNVKWEAPFWCFLLFGATTLISGLVGGWWISHRRSRTVPPADLNTPVGTIRFDYLPVSPAKHGWRIVTENPENREPVFSCSTDAPVPGAISISSNGRYLMDYSLDASFSFADIVEFFEKPTRNGPFYLMVRVTSLDRRHSEDVWLNHSIGNGKPRKVGDKEWAIEVNGRQVGNGWVSLTLRLDEEVKQTLGSEGLLYDKLLAIRIRGSISLSPITFRKMPEEMLVEKSDNKEEHLLPARPG